MTRMHFQAAVTLCMWLAACPAVCDPGSDLDALVAAYPEALVRHDGNLIYWQDGTTMPVSDGKADKTFDQLLRGASILDQFRLPYTAGRPTSAPTQNFDPGRFRNEAFFKKMYGDCANGEVDKRLTTITWLPKSGGSKVRVTSVNGVAKRLSQISAEVDELPSAIKAAAFPIAGVVACRPVADTGKMSMHGYGSAIDLNLKFSDYWLWQRKSSPSRYRNRMPLEIVEIFERYGFIWGGKWAHFDTMHFEYRPELLATGGGR